MFSWQSISNHSSRLFSIRTATFVVILTLCSICCFIAYYRPSFDFAWYSKRFIYQDNHDYFVKSYRLQSSEGIMEMTGYYLSGNHTYRASVKLNGLDILLNVIHLDRLNDPKYETADLPDQKYFIHSRNVKDVKCRLVINGDETETKKASNMATVQPRTNPNGPMNYINKTLDCNTFIAERGYIMSSLTNIEAAFPIAYSILMYKDIEQVERLLRAIYRPQNIYCIHVDSKTSRDIYRAIEGIAKCFPNVFMTARRIDVKWGRFSVLEPELMCMEELLQRKKTWKYFINLTGQEFPLRTNYELIRILMTYNGANDIEGTLKRYVLKHAPRL